jgi:hypothetical protein
MFWPVDRQSVDALYEQAARLGITLVSVSHHESVDKHHGTLPWLLMFCIVRRIKNVFSKQASRSTSRRAGSGPSARPR